MTRARIAIVVAFAALPLVSATGAVAQPKDGGSPQATTGARERSRAAFRRGVAELRAQDWKGARASFEEAWTLYPHPSILLNLGIARLRTDDPVRAEQDLLRFLAEDAGAAPDELASAREALAEARAKIGTVRVTAAPPSARIFVDDALVSERVRAAGGEVVAEVRVTAGDHAIRVEAEGHATDARSVEVGSNREVDVRVKLAELARSAPREPAPSSARTTVGWVSAGFAGFALVASGAFALRASSLSDDYGDRANPDTFQNPDVRSEGIGYRTAADVALGTALVAGAAAVVLLLTDLGAPRSTLATPPAARGAVVRW